MPRCGAIPPVRRRRRSVFLVSKFHPENKFWISKVRQGGLPWHREAEERLALGAQRRHSDVAVTLRDLLVRSHAVLKIMRTHSFPVFIFSLISCVKESYVSFARPRVAGMC